MRRMKRIVLLTTLALAAPVLAGCADGFDMDKLDVFHLNDKKKLPGDRQALFPEGVPGVSQGIPPEYLKGNQPPSDQALLASPPADGAQAQPAPAAEPPKAEEKPKPKPKPKKTVKRTAPKPTPAAAAPVKPVSQQPAPAASSSAPWPPADQNAQSTSTPAPWPAAPPPGTFSR